MGKAKTCTAVAPHLDTHAATDIEEEGENPSQFLEICPELARTFFPALEAACTNLGRQ